MVSDATPQSDRARRDAFDGALSEPIIDLSKLRALAIDGVPEGHSIRPLVWKLFLGYLPLQRDLWERHLSEKRAAYARFVREFGSLHNSSSVPLGAGAVSSEQPEHPGVSAGGSNTRDEGSLQRASLSAADHPLSSAPESRWRQRFLDEETRAQVERDVERTHPDLPFFGGSGEPATSNRAALARVLFVYARLNPGIKYVQGMNELLAPLLYVLSTDPSAGDASHAEADAFFCFVELMSDCRDHFCQQLDDSEAGIKSTLAQLAQCLRVTDPQLAGHVLDVNAVSPQFFAFRWITLMLTQEFDFPDALRLWDAVLAAEHGRQRALLRICLAMLVLLRDRLLEGDFAANMRILQHYPIHDTELIVRTARRLWLDGASSAG